jgi:nucleoside-triphosphatase THEP1
VIIPDALFFVNGHRGELCEMNKSERFVFRATPADRELIKALAARLQRSQSNVVRAEFVGRSEKLLVFGLPGRGKTHFAAAVGHALIQAGYSVLFTPTYRLVDELLRAKRDLLLEHELRRLDRYDVLILDDIGYVQQSRDEMEVLFTLLEAAGAILPGFPANLQQTAVQSLTAKHVEVRLDAKVAGYDGDTITLAGSESIAASTLLWSAGVRAAALIDQLGVEQARQGRVKVTPELNIPGHPDVYVG